MTPLSKAFEALYGREMSANAAVIYGRHALPSPDDFPHEASGRFPYKFQKSQIDLRYASTDLMPLSEMLSIVFVQAFHPDLRASYALTCSRKGVLRHAAVMVSAHSVCSCAVRETASGGGCYGGVSPNYTSLCELQRYNKEAGKSSCRLLLRARASELHMCR